jgi:hypothetical protein
MAPRRDGKSFPQPGFSRAGLVNVPNDRAVGDERSEQPAVDVEFLQEFIRPGQPHRIERIGPGRKGEIGTRLAGQTEGDPIGHVEPIPGFAE